MAAGQINNGSVVMAVQTRTSPQLCLMFILHVSTYVNGESPVVGEAPLPADLEIPFLYFTKRLTFITVFTKLITAPVSAIEHTRIYLRPNFKLSFCLRLGPASASVFRDGRKVNISIFFFNVLLPVHLSIILEIDHLNAQILVLQ